MPQGTRVGSIYVEADVRDEKAKAAFKRLEQDGKAASSKIQQSLSRIDSRLVADALADASKHLKEFGKRSDDVQKVRASFESLTAAQGLNASRMKSELVSASKGLLSEFDAMRHSNQAMLLGMVQSEEEFGKMANAAIALGQATGRTANEAIGDLVEGLGKGSTELLDNLGIVHRANAAYEEWGRRIGKKASQLTDVEKRQAFVTLGIEKATAAAEKQGGIIVTTNGALEIQKNRLQDVIDETAEWAGPIATVSGELTGIGSQVAMMHSAWPGAFSAISKALMGPAGVVIAFTAAATAIGKYIEQSRLAQKGSEIGGMSLDGLESKRLDILNQIADLERRIQEIGKSGNIRAIAATKGLQQRKADLQETLGLVVEEMKALNMVQTGDESGDGEGGQIGATKRSKEELKRLKDAYERIDRLVAEHNEKLKRQKMALEAAKAANEAFNKQQKDHLRGAARDTVKVLREANMLLAPPGKSPVKKRAEEEKALAKQRKDEAREKKKRDKDEEEAHKAALRRLYEMASTLRAISGLMREMGQDGAAAFADLASNAVHFVASLKTGDIGGIIGAVTGAISSLKSLFGRSDKEKQAEKERIEAARRQAEAIIEQERRIYEERMKHAKDVADELMEWKFIISDVDDMLAALPDTIDGEAIRAQLTGALEVLRGLETQMADLQKFKGFVGGFTPKSALHQYAESGDTKFLTDALAEYVQAGGDPAKFREFAHALGESKTFEELVDAYRNAEEGSEEQLEALQALRDFMRERGVVDKNIEDGIERMRSILAARLGEAARVLEQDTSKVLHEIKQAVDRAREEIVAAIKEISLGRSPYDSVYANPHGASAASYIATTTGAQRRAEAHRRGLVNERGAITRQGWNWYRRHSSGSSTPDDGGGTGGGGGGGSQPPPETPVNMQLTDQAGTVIARIVRDELPDELDGSGL